MATSQKSDAELLKAFEQIEGITNLADEIDNLEFYDTKSEDFKLQILHAIEGRRDFYNEGVKEMLLSEMDSECDKLVAKEKAEHQLDSNELKEFEDDLHQYETKYYNDKLSIYQQKNEELIP